MKFRDHNVDSGQRKRFFLDLASLYDYTQLNIPIEVIRGKEEGPTIFISAAIHGDEINGVEIIKRLLHKPSLKKLKGALIAVPVVNIFGFNNKSRYLPDRRDLNRSFPGNPKGPLAARMANIFMKEIVSKCTHGIDLHTAAVHRTNLPQIRACLDDPETNALAASFGVPVLINSALRDGSLREAARSNNVCTLLFEGGEALRFNEEVIKVGLNGCLAVMRQIGMLPVPSKKNMRPRKTFICKNSVWVRAPHSGSFRAVKALGNEVQTGKVIAVITDPFGNKPYEVKAPEYGIIIGMSTIPLVNQGDAMFHLATFKDSASAKKAIHILDNFVSDQDDI